jgi:hypothetical protein
MVFSLLSNDHLRPLRKEQSRRFIPHILNLIKVSYIHSKSAQIPLNSQNSTQNQSRNAKQNNKHAIRKFLKTLKKRKLSLCLPRTTALPRCNQPQSPKSKKSSVDAPFLFCRRDVTFVCHSTSLRVYSSCCVVLCCVAVTSLLWSPLSVLACRVHMSVRAHRPCTTTVPACVTQPRTSMFAVKISKGRFFHRSRVQSQPYLYHRRTIRTSLEIKDSSQNSTLNHVADRCVKIGKIVSSPLFEQMRVGDAESHFPETCVVLTCRCVDVCILRPMRELEATGRCETSRSSWWNPEIREEGPDVFVDHNGFMVECGERACLRDRGFTEVSEASGHG